MIGWIVAALAALVGLFFYLDTGENLVGGLGAGELLYLFIGGALIAIYVGSISYEYRGRGGRALRHAAIWVGLGLLLITGYAYRDVLADAAMRVSGELSPAGSATTLEAGENGERAVRLRRRDGGHFAARGQVNGITMSLLVDTGASTVVLKPADAERAGIDLASLNYSSPVDTANGMTFAAPVRLRSVAIGPIEVRDVEALVARPGSLKESLLGMSFLKRLRSYEFSGDFLTLRAGG
jgi:aspartyl protease family protein